MERSGRKITQLSNMGNLWIFIRQKRYVRIQSFVHRIGWWGTCALSSMVSFSFKATIEGQITLRLLTAQSSA